MGVGLGLGLGLTLAVASPAVAALAVAALAVALAVAALAVAALAVAALAVPSSRFYPATAVLPTLARVERRELRLQLLARTGNGETDSEEASPSTSVRCTGAPLSRACSPIPATASRRALSPSSTTSHSSRPRPWPCQQRQRRRPGHPLDWRRCNCSSDHAACEAQDTGRVAGRLTIIGSPCPSQAKTG